MNEIEQVPYPGLRRHHRLRTHPEILSYGPWRVAPVPVAFASGYWELTDGFDFRAVGTLDDWRPLSAAIGAMEPAILHVMNVRGPAVGSEGAMPILGRWHVVRSASGRVFSQRVTVNRRQHRPARRYTCER